MPPIPSAPDPRAPRTTKDRIVEVAGELFAARTYAGTSMADIAERLQISKAALYHHFKAKEEILDRLLAEPASNLSALGQLATRTRPRAQPSDLLGGLIDMFASSTTAAALFGNDASALADYVRRHDPDEKIAQILNSLTGPRPTTTSTIRAHAALAAAKDGTMTALQLEGKLTSRAREQVLASALAALAAMP